MANTEPRKNTIGVLKAYSLLVKQYRNAPRLLIKGLTEKQLLLLLAQQKLQMLSSQIDLVGYVDYEDLPFIYQGASMLWFPSFSEGFGLPIVEAMASGLPVVTSDVSCMPEIAGNAALLIDPHQPQTIATAALKILCDVATRYYLSEMGKQRATLFTWDNAVRRLVQVYNEIEKMI